MSKKCSFAIPYPPTKAGKTRWSKLFGFNRFYAGVHWSKRKEAADYWHILTREAMEKSKVRKVPFDDPVSILVYFNDRLDCTNHSVMVKFIEDGMKGRILHDDNRAFVKSVTMGFHDEDYILVEVTPWNT